jgi:hypothetical protein
MLPEAIGRLTGLRTLNLHHNDELAVLPAGLSQLRNLEVDVWPPGLDLRYSPGLAALYDLQSREGLPALLAHLAAQGEPAAVQGQL